MFKTTWRLCAIAALLAPMLTACNSEGDGEGGECQRCHSSSPQCDSGLTCATFNDTFGKDHQRCAKPDTRRCDL